MTAGPLAVRDDLFGFVRAIMTPRQGVDDNTNPKPPDAAAEPTAAPPSAVNAPLPSGTRVIPEGSVGPQAGPVTADDAAILTNSPAYKLWQAQQAQLRLQAEENQRWDTAMSGLSGLASGLSGGDWRGNAGFGGAARPGSNLATGSDALSLEQIRQFADDATKAKALAANKEAAYAFAKARGIPKEYIDAAIAGGDFTKLRELGFNVSDPKAAGEGALKQGEATRAAELDRIMRDPDLAARVMNAAGISDPVTFRTVYLSGKIDDVVANAAKGTGDYQDYIKAYPGGNDPKTGKPYSYAEYLQRKQDTASPTGGLTKIFGEQIGKQIGTSVEAARVQAQNLPNMVQLYEDLRTGKGAVGGFLGRDDVRALMNLADGLGIDLQGVKDTQKMAAIIGEQVLARAKTLGSNPTDTDREYIKQIMGGDFSNSREALIAIARTNIKASVQAQIEANNRIDGLLEVVTNPEQRALLMSQRQNVADHSNLIFAPGHTEILTKAAADPDPAARDRAVANFDRYYGPGMGKYFLEKRGLNVGR